ncbi:MAG: oligosaccharide flippase family protein [Patescibacteria group bacterium]
MGNIYNKVLSLVKSTTAKDTYILFVGNIMSAFFGFIFIYILTHRLTVDEFGVFSAAANLIVIISSFTDLGITTAMINFVSQKLGNHDNYGANRYLKASFIIRFVSVAIVSTIVLLIPKFVATNLLSTSDFTVSYWVGLISIGLTAWLTFPYAMMAYKKFWQSVALDWSLGIPRILIFLSLASLLPINLNLALMSYGLSTILPIFFGFSIIGLKFLKVKATKNDYLSLVKFSGWLGVNRIVSSISGRLDITMLANLTNAVVVGEYSIASRLSSFVIVLSSSLGSVLSTRFSRFNDREKEKRYLIKSTLFTIPIVFGVILWIIIAKPFVLILFGQKYFESIKILQYLLISIIPFILSTPAVTAIVHAMRKPVYIGVFSFVQVLMIFLFNYFFINLFDGLGPAVAFILSNTVLAIYSFAIVWKYYFSI